MALAIIFPPSLLAGAALGGVVAPPWARRKRRDEVQRRERVRRGHHPGTSGIVAVLDITAVDAVKATIPDADEVQSVPIDDETAAAVTTAANAATSEAKAG